MTIVMNIQATKYISGYIQLINPGFGLLVNGKWGSGKSWYVKNTLSEIFHDVENAYLYVSLYECANKSDIEDEFFRQMHPFLSAKPITVGTKLIKSALKATLRFDVDGDGRSDTTISSSLPSMSSEEFNEFSKTKHKVIVFDDFERSSMDIQELMGYLNSFVENLGYNIIIICNEDEIGKDRKEIYKIAKEKTIGKTLTIEPHSEDALNSFIKSCSSDEAYKKVLEKKRKIILKIFHASESNNLRNLDKCMKDFKWLYDELNARHKKISYFIDDLLSAYLIFSIEIMSGEHTPDELLNIEEDFADYTVRSVDGGGEVKNIYNSIKKKYPFFDIFGTPLDYKTWFDVFVKGVPSKQALREAFNNTGYFVKRKNPTWQKLWYRNYIDDVAFAKLIKKMLKELEDRKYTDIGEVLHIVGLISYFHNKGIMEINESELLSLLREYVDWLIEKEHIIPDLRGYPSYPSDSAFNLGFVGADFSIFKKIVSHLDIKIEEITDVYVRKNAKDLIEMFENDLQKFRVLTRRSNDAAPFSYVPFLIHFPVKRFAEILITHMDTGHITNVHFFFKDRYRSFPPELDEERVWLTELAIELKRIKTSREGLLSGVKIGEFLDSSVVGSMLESEVENTENDRIQP